MSTPTVTRLRCGDGLRAVAAMSIFFLHVGVDSTPDGRPDPDLGWGTFGEALLHLDLGLSIFFVLSGYLIAGPFVRAFVEGRPLPSVARFARNRALRILPVYWAGLIAVLLYFGTEGDPVGDVLALFALLDLYLGIPSGFPIAQSWTLTTEMAFYASVPIMAAIFVAVGRAGRLRTPEVRAAAALVLLAGATLLSLWQRSRAPSTMPALNNPLGIFCAFSPGVALAIVEPVVRDGLRRDRARAILVGRALLGLGALGVLVFVLAAPSYYVALHHARAVQSAAAALFAFGLLGGLLALQLGADRCPRWLEHPVTVWLGERSYPIYVIHFGALLAVIPLAPDDASRATLATIMAVTGLPLTLALAALLHRYVERPFLARRRKTDTGVELAVATT